MGLRLFPIAGGAVGYTDDFDYEKPDGRHHQGNDLFAPTGRPLIAVDDGLAKYGTDVLGGNVVNLYAPDGTRYYYAHLSRFEQGAPGSSRNVRAGDVLGYVGTTGNAVGGPSHVHFEIHPGGGAAIDPFRYLKAAPIAPIGGFAGSGSKGIGTLLVLTVGLGAIAWLAVPGVKQRTRRLLA